MREIEAQIRNFDSDFFVSLNFEQSENLLREGVTGLVE